MENRYYKSITMMETKEFIHEKGKIPQWKSKTGSRQPEGPVWVRNWSKEKPSVRINR